MNGRSGPLPSQILQFTDFLVALRDLYGLHIRPIVDLERDAGPPPIRADYESQNAFVIAFMNWSTRARAIRVDAEKSFTSGFFKRHKDHATEVPFLMTEEEAEYANLLYRPGIARINPVYNYLLLDYEKVLESKVKSSGVTHGIPNLYVLTREAMNDESVQAFIPGRHRKYARYKKILKTLLLLAVSLGVYAPAPVYIQYLAPAATAACMRAHHTRQGNTFALGRRQLIGFYHFSLTLRGNCLLAAKQQNRMLQ